MRPPRGLSDEERAAWERLAGTVVPLHPRRPPSPSPAIVPAQAPPAGAMKAVKRAPPASAVRKATLPPPSPRAEPGLDSSWERKLRGAKIAPDFTLDLHGLTLDAAHARLGRGLTQAKAMGARLVLVVTGKPRPVEAADRGERRGAIRAKILDWLAASAHGADIAAIRKAHPRHGGEGALYIVLKRQR